MMYTGELNYSVTMNFTLHTEPNANVPEFTISCRTHGGPATTVQWTVNGSITLTHIDHETSQLILNTSLDSVYDNRFRVRGSRSGTYNCTVSTTGTRTHKGINVKGRLISCLTMGPHIYYILPVAGEPASLTAVISESNSTHVDITVSWESPRDPVTGYVIYFEPKGGPINSVEVPISKTRQQLIDLPISDSYNISIVGLLTENLPSVLVGPIAVTPGESLWIAL